MYRTLIPELADRYHVVAPDLPGFGLSDAPDRATFKYSFDHLADVIEHFTEALRLDRFDIFDRAYPVSAHWAASRLSSA
jgi:pimeloyl-ACP methyl ester carboxylesterase